MNQTNAWNPIWEEVFNKQTWGKYPAESLISFIARNFYNVPDRSGVRIIDLGSGPGANLWYLGNEGFDVTGIEGSKTAVTQCRARLEAEGLNNVKVINSDIINELDNYPDNSFDAVVDAQCFSHIVEEYIVEILDKCKRVLKPEGLLYSRTFSNDNSTNDMILDEKGNVEMAMSGPFLNKGFVRLSDIEDIKNLYGTRFEINSINHLQMKQMSTNTLSNNSDNDYRTSEWVVICENNK